MDPSRCTADPSTSRSIVSNILLGIMSYPHVYPPVPRSQKVLARNSEQPLAVDLEFDATGAWQYAIDPSTFQFHTTSVGSLPSPIFDSGKSPLSITITACPINWATAGDTFASSPPTNPSCTGRNTTLTLTPFGVSLSQSLKPSTLLTKYMQTTKLRISEFPVMA